MNGLLFTKQFTHIFQIIIYVTNQHITGAQDYVTKPTSLINDIQMAQLLHNKHI